MRTLLVAAFLFAASAFAADISGNWKATAEGPNGSMTRTFTFKVDGEKLTGETESSFAGKSVIKDGKVKGDDVSFTLDINMQGNEMKVAYKGKVVNKDEIKLSADFGGNAIEWVAKRQQ